ncbi:MAG: hypothetical protein ACRC28_13020 [Clostridium sp.]|uniref:hypothetical protein n=1 Tax=Clostridium sp. TaxID=1506 RepID=UPI003F3F5716
MKKVNIKLILGILVSLVVLTIGIVGIDKYLKAHRYEVIDTSTTYESKEELNSVVEVITKGTYQSVQSLEKEKEKAYIVVADENVNDSQINDIIKMGSDLNVKISFLDNDVVNKNSEIQRNGDTVIPRGVNLERIVREKQIEAVNLDSFYSFNSPDTKSVVLFIGNAKKLENSKSEFNKKVENLKEQGYVFKAFA